MVDEGEDVGHLESGGSVDREDFGVSSRREDESEVGFMGVGRHVVEVSCAAGRVIEC